MRWFYPTLLLTIGCQSSSVREGVVDCTPLEADSFPVYEDPYLVLPAGLAQVGLEWIDRGKSSISLVHTPAEMHVLGDGNLAVEVKLACEPEAVLTVVFPEGTDPLVPVTSYEFDVPTLQQGSGVVDGAGEQILVTDRSTGVFNLGPRLSLKSYDDDSPLDIDVELMSFGFEQLPIIE